LLWKHIAAWPPIPTSEEYKVRQIRLRAERKAGQLLAEMEKLRGARGTGSDQHKKVVGSSSATPPKTLKEVGITKDQSASWQKLGAMSQDFQRRE
jgi:hypothetical protein